MQWYALKSETDHLKLQKSIMKDNIHMLHGDDRWINTSPSKSRRLRILQSIIVRKPYPCPTNRSKRHSLKFNIQRYKILEVLEGQHHLGPRICILQRQLRSAGSTTSPGKDAETRQPPSRHTRSRGVATARFLLY